MSKPPATFPRAILIVRTGAIGDVVNALVLASALRQHQPGVRIGWVVHPLSAPLLEGNPSVDVVHLWQRGGGWRELRRLLAEVRAARYDAALDLQRLQKSGFVARFSGAPRVVGYDRGRSKEASWIWSRERIPAGDPRHHMVEQYLEFARHLGAAPGAPRWEWPPLDGARRRARELLAPLGGVRYLVLNVGASKAPNRWPPERFGALARELGGSIRCVLTGGPSDRAAADAAIAAAAGAPLADLVGRTTLLELAAVLEGARLAVTADTGPMHLAAALGTQVVALFGPADPARTGPFGARHSVVREPTWDGSWMPAARMSDLSVATVRRAVSECLEPSGRGT